MRGEGERASSLGALYLTNVQQFYERQKNENDEPEEMTAVLGPKPAQNSGIENFDKRIVDRGGRVVVLNDEDIQLDTFKIGEKVSIITIAPDPKKQDKDIAIPVLSPILTRKKSLAEEIAELDVNAFSNPVLPRKQDDATAKSFRYEGYDLITLQRLIEREYTIPEPQTAEEVIGYYARRIAQDVKLPSQFAVLAPKVREFLETKAFGEPVRLDEPAMIKAIGSNVAQYVTVKTFVEALRKLVISELEPQLLHAGRLLSETPPFPWSRATVDAEKSILCRATINSRRSSRSSCRGRAMSSASPSSRNNLASQSNTRTARETCATTSQISLR